MSAADSGPPGSLAPTTGVRLLTVGHGTLPAADFTSLLKAAEVGGLVDVRSYPGSRRHPHFGRDRMSAWLPEAGIGYRWEPRLGGRRRPQSESPNSALVNAGFRGYADHMASDDFETALALLLEEAATTSVAVMCAESLWWRCHRKLLADAATLLRGAEVLHLFHDGRLAAHIPSAVASVERADSGVPRLVYAELAPTRQLNLGL